MDVKALTCCCSLCNVSLVLATCFCDIYDIYDSCNLTRSLQFYADQSSTLWFLFVFFNILLEPIVTPAFLFFKCFTTYVHCFHVKHFHIPTNTAEPTSIRVCIGTVLGNQLACIMASGKTITFER